MGACVARVDADAVAVDWTAEWDEGFTDGVFGASTVMGGKSIPEFGAVFVAA